MWISLGLVASGLIAGAVSQSAAPQPAAPPRRDVFPIRLDTLRPDRERSFDPGTEAEAKTYYKSVSEQLKLPGGDRPFEDLNALLAYFGYDRLKAEELDVLSPKDLIPKGPAGAVLAARYFSPKTSDVSGRSNKLSWRKVVRLTPQADSGAHKAGLAAMHFLSVAYVDCPTDDPFPANKSRTLNVQVLLTRGPKWATDQDPAYWLVFDPAGGKYVLGYSTTTSWDAADPDLVDGLQPYYVPTACQMCHGGDRKFAVLHSFDTDWYIDKVQPEEDFGMAFKNAKWGPLYDCEKNPNAQAYKDGFDVFRKLNAEILSQNQAVLAQAEATDPRHKQATTQQVARQTTATAKWCDLHVKSHQHVPPFGRALGNASGGERVWSKDDPIDKELLPLLNRYCYRCHSSVRYNAFAKEELIRKPEKGRKIVDMMITRMQAKDLVNRMPQDRDMEDRNNRDWKKLLNLLGRLQAKYQN